MLWRGCHQGDCLAMWPGLGEAARSLGRKPSCRCIVLLRCGWSQWQRGGQEGRASAQCVAETVSSTHFLPEAADRAGMKRAWPVGSVRPWGSSEPNQIREAPVHVACAVLQFSQGFDTALESTRFEGRAMCRKGCLAVQRW